MRPFLILFLFFSQFQSHAQDSSEVILESQYEAELHPPGPRINEELISPEAVAELKEEKEYGYMKNLDSLLKSRNRANNSAGAISLPGKSIFDSPWFFYPAIAAVIIFIGYFFYRLFSTSRPLIRKRSIQVSSREVVEEVAGPFKGDLNAAKQQGDFRLAIRILFLQTLDRMDAAELIENVQGKTNRDFLKEMPAGFRVDFKYLVLKYEYFWYGNHQPGSELYENIEKSYNEFLKRLPGA